MDLRSRAPSQHRPRCRREAAPWPPHGCLWAILLVFALSSGPAPVRAQQGLNEALVDLEDDSNQARIAAFPRALEQVFTKLSGRRPQTVSPERQSEIASAALLVQKYRYQKSPSGDGMTLWVSFDEQALAESAKRAGVKVWAGPRRAPLLWVALISGERAALVGPDSEDNLAEILLDAAWRRGLPVRLPLLDLEDRMRVKPEAVGVGDQKALVKASERYPAGPLVAARVEQAGDTGWTARWQMLGAGKRVNWLSQGVTPGEALAAGVDGLAELIAARDAASVGGTRAGNADPAAGKTTRDRDAGAAAGKTTRDRDAGAATVETTRDTDAGAATVETTRDRDAGAATVETTRDRDAGAATVETVEIAVRGILSRGDRRRVMAYLRELDGVTRFATLPRQGRSARFRMDVPGGEKALRRMISSGRMLEPDGAGPGYRMLR